MGRAPVQPLIFWQHPVAVTYPSGVWTPVPLNNLITTQGRLITWSDYVPTSTTIAAGSDLAVLPQAVINVVSTTPAGLPPFADAGYLVVRIGGTDRVIKYTGRNATQFTGCTLGVGTLGTGQAIAQANCVFRTPPRGRPSLPKPGGGVGPATAEVAFAANAVNDRGIRFRDCGLPFELIAGMKTERACATQIHHIQTTEQPAWSAAGTRIEAFQDSGGNLDSVVEQVAAPRLVVVSATRLVA